MWTTDFDKDTKAVYYRKDGLFKKWCRSKRTMHKTKKKKNLGKLHILHKINSKWIKSLNAKSKTITYLEENTREKHSFIKYKSIKSHKR